MNPVSPKVYGASGGVGLAGSIVTVMIYVLKIQPPPEVIAAMTTLIGVVGAAAFGYLTPHTVGVAMQAPQAPAAPPAPIAIPSPLPPVASPPVI